MFPAFAYSHKPIDNSALKVYNFNKESAVFNRKGEHFDRISYKLHEVHNR